MQLEQSLSELEKNMNWNKALIYVTSFSYLGGVTTSIGGYPLLMDIHPISQAIGFLIAFFILLSSFRYRSMKWILSAFYGIAEYSIKLENRMYDLMESTTDESQEEGR